MLQWISFIFLALVSAFFTTNLALELGTSTVEKVAITAGSIAIEVLKLYCLVSANSKRRAWALYGTYGFVALYSLFASFGYAVTVVDRVGAISKVIDHSEEIAMEHKNLSLMDDAITNLKQAVVDKRAAASALPEDRLSRKIEIQKLIMQDQATIEEYIAKKSKLQERVLQLQMDEKQSRGGQKKTMYEVIGSTMGVSAKWVAFWVLAVFSMSIELGIFITSPHSAFFSDKKKPTPKEPKKVKAKPVKTETKLFGRRRIEKDPEEG